MEALFETGWLGFLVALLMILTGLRMALRVIRGATFEAAVLGAAFILLAVNLQSLGAYAFRPFWFLWALLIAVGSTATYRSRAEALTVPEPPNTGQTLRPANRYRRAQYTADL